MEPTVFDVTEPEPMVLGGRYFEDENYLWRVELYLMSKYQPEFVQATIFKVRSAVIERAKIVKTDHTVLPSLSALQSAIEADIAHHVQWVPQRTHRGTAARPPRPNIGRAYQKELEQL